jgi:hypothetical protein
MYETHYPDKRFRLTLAFVKKHLPQNASILDLGVTNPLGEMLKNDFIVFNTKGEDLDEHQKGLTQKADAVTAFEILEHLLNPYTVLSKIQSDKLFISVPLRLWFSGAYRSKTDVWDRHFHEFECWQLDWLLEKTGWQIEDKLTFTHPVKRIGFRPLLRLITPRYYLVYATRKK